MWAKRGHSQLWLLVQFFGEFNLGYAGKKLARMGTKRGMPNRDAHPTPPKLKITFRCLDYLIDFYLFFGGFSQIIPFSAIRFAGFQ